MSHTDPTSPQGGDAERDSDQPPEREATPPAPRPTEDLVGETIGQRYQLEARLGTGIIGQVYRARRLDDGSAVVIKVLDERHRPDPNVVRRFLREGEALQGVDHPCIARTLETGTDAQGRPFVCSELFEGEPVTSMLRRGPLTLRRITTPICELLSALSEAHRRGVLHGCIKPSNVLVHESETQQLTIKLRDFGMGRLLKAVPGTATTKYGVPCAAPEYMAPEQAGSVEVDGRADVYAAGVLMYELLTGQVPFSGPTAKAILDKHRNEPVVPPSKLRIDRRIPLEIENVCMRALEKDVRPRFHSPREMRSALRDALELLGARADLPIEAPPDPGAPHEASRDRLTMPGEQLRSGQKVGLGAGLLLLVSGVLWMSAPDEIAPNTQSATVLSGATEQSGAEAVRKGQQLLEAGDLAGARAVLTRAHEALGETPEVCRWLGEVLVLSGEKQRGRELLERYMALTPEPQDRRAVDALLDEASR